MSILNLRNCDNVLARVYGISCESLASVRVLRKTTQRSCLLWACEGAFQIRGSRNGYLTGKEAVLMHESETFEVVCVSAETKVLMVEFSIDVQHENIVVSDVSVNISDFFSVDDVTGGLLQQLAEYSVLKDRDPLVVNAWMALLIARLRAGYEAEMSDTLRIIDSVTLWGIVDHESGEDLELQISDVRLLLQDADPNAEDRELLCFNCSSQYIERPVNHIGYTVQNDPGGASYGVFRVPDREYFKLWLFQKNPEKITDIQSCVGGLLVLHFSVRANHPCHFMIGACNSQTYKFMGQEAVVSHKNRWLTMEVSLFNGAGATNAYVVEAQHYIAEHFREKLTIQIIADHLHLHPSYLSKLFKRCTGQTILNYITFHRISEVENLLLGTDMTIESIAYEVGFYDIHHLQKIFKSVVGCSPSAYRKRNKSPEEEDENKENA